VRLVLHREQLDDAVADVVDLLVLPGLLEERRDVDLRQVGGPGEVQVCPQGRWPMVNRSASASSASTSPVDSTMNGSSIPLVCAIGRGSRATYSFGVFGRSRISADSRRSLSIIGYCAVPTRTCDATAISRSARSLNSEFNVFRTLPTPGTLRSVAIAPRSAGCS
jgi:hypothetical protein